VYGIRHHHDVRQKHGLEDLYRRITTATANATLYIGWRAIGLKLHRIRIRLNNITSSANERIATIGSVKSLAYRTMTDDTEAIS
jgi:hypothetical protein